MLSTLDPFTNYISAGQIEDYRFMSTGQYGGIGALVGKRGKKMLVLEPYKDKPADKAGLKAGDQLIKIDTEQIAGTDMTTEDVKNILRGQPGSEVTLTVQRPGEDEPLEVLIKRDKIKIKNVPFFGMATEDVGYISLTGFTQEAGKEVRDAYQTLKAENPGMKGLVLDLRGNPGGLLMEAVNISGIFVPAGEKVVETRGRMEGSQREYKTMISPVDLEMPLAVVTDKRSASASEIVSGVMQDLDRGIVVGDRTYGKGLVQTTRPLSYNAQIKLTTAKYYIPSGRCIQAINYAERDEDGAVKRIPDSLRNEFWTRNGRRVLDGGGIEPDVKVEVPKLKAVSKELRRQNLIFDFVTQFAIKNPEITNPSDFEVTEEVYNDFIAFAGEKEFDFNTRAEKQLEKLKDIVEEEDDFKNIAAQYAALKNELEARKGNALRNHKEEIRQLLKDEIVLRYHYREGAIEASFKDDPDVKAAIDVLNDPVRYKKILAGE